MSLVGWIPMDIQCVGLLPCDREYSIIEAAFYLKYAHVTRRHVSVNGLAKRFGWSRKRVSAFISNCNAKIEYSDGKQGLLDFIDRKKIDVHGTFFLNDKALSGLNPHNSARPSVGIGLSKRYDIMQRDGFSCVLCGKTAEESRLEIDHIIPVSAGGDDKADNLRTLCFACNRGKGSKLEV